MTGSIRVNGTEAPLAETVAALVVRLGIAPDAKGVAVARNGGVVPRSAWAGTPLLSGDEIEVIRAVQGG
ncbi:MAG TPA: sulfur carrier protein ThiS [Stellaceae bacterium]|nr:sulfur carrier protein ThiS [Stellaceae bacterium]